MASKNVLQLTTSKFLGKIFMYHHLVKIADNCNELNLRCIVSMLYNVFRIPQQS